MARVPVYRDALVVPEHANSLSAKGTNFQETAGTYLQDMIELNEQWKALLGVRYDIFGQEYDDDRAANVDLDRTDKTWSAPAFGFPAGSGAVLLRLGQPRLPALEEVFAVSTANADLEPEETTNYEVGSKWDLLDGRLAVTTAVFRLERTNMKTSDPLNLSLLILAGEQRTDGFEGHLQRPAQRQVAAVRRLCLSRRRDHRIQQQDQYVANEGQTPTLTPQNSANLWLVRRSRPCSASGHGRQLCR